LDESEPNTEETLEEEIPDAEEDATEEESEEIETPQQLELEETIARTPVAIFTGSRDKNSDHVKAILSKYDMSTQPTIVEVDSRSDSTEMKTALDGFTGEAPYPVIFIDGELIEDDLDELDVNGELLVKLSDAGLLSK
jgi:glutaredoxin